jgi:hypothetical protein
MKHEGIPFELGHDPGNSVTDARAGGVSSYSYGGLICFHTTKLLGG